MKKLRQLIATAALLGVTSVPALLAQDTRTYSKSSEDATRTMSVSALPNGARADVEGVDCAALDSIVAREASSRGLERDVSCADGFGAVSLYGDVTAAQSALTETATEVLDQPSQTLTAAEVANEKAMINAVKPRLRVYMPGNNGDTPFEVLLKPGRGDAVEIVVDITQFEVGGQPFFRQEKSLVATVNYSGVVDRTTGRFDVGFTLSTITAASDIVDPVAQSADRIQLCLENGEGANNPCVDNYTTGTHTVSRLAQNDWSTGLKSTHPYKLNGRDHLTNDNLAVDVIADKVCEDVDAEGLPGNCKDIILSIVRNEAVESYRGELTCPNEYCGTAVMNYTSVYDGTGKLTNNSIAALATTDPDWTFNKELRQHYKSPEFNEAWGPFEGMSTTTYRQEGSNLDTLIRYVTIYADDSPTHLEP